MDRDEDERTKPISSHLDRIQLSKNKRKLSLCSDCLDDFLESIKEFNNPKNT